MVVRKVRGGDLREACLQEALAIIETAGVEGLSLREVARRLGISHQAPYKHFASRDHILAEIVRRAFDSFAHYLDTHQQNGDPHAELAAMGRAYFSYAQAHPLQYRLMFGTPLPDPAQHPDMMHSARHTFTLLQACIDRMSQTLGKPTSPENATLDALFVWAALHGLASILQTRALDTLALPDPVLKQAASHILLQIGAALGTHP
ncbi:MAG: TetR/AcrR family transcriptional regulator [Armatimonadetes bacterium]|nr:TetR/AcrR family transcriptional regulator [Anaerolineae bacterium]